MSASKDTFKNILTGQLPEEIVKNLLEEYQNIKQQFFLHKYQPSELNGGRFSECILRILEYLNNGSYTPFGTKADSERIIRAAENNTNLKDTIRFFIPRTIRVLLDVRNKRDVAHPGGEVNPNYSDSLFVIHTADWLLTELVRHFYNCSITEAQKNVTDINEVKIPIVADINGFIRIQDTKLSSADKVLVILYYKNPEFVKDSDLLKWLRYKNSSEFKRNILKKLDKEALIHYENGECIILPKGIRHIETHIPLDLLS